MRGMRGVRWRPGKCGERGALGSEEGAHAFPTGGREGRARGPASRERQRSHGGIGNQEVQRNRQFIALQATRGTERMACVSKADFNQGRANSRREIRIRAASRLQ